MSALLTHPWVDHAASEHVALYDDKEDANAPAEVERLVKLGSVSMPTRRSSTWVPEPVSSRSQSPRYAPRSWQ